MVAFDQAAEHLVRLENEEKTWVLRENELTEALAAAQGEIDVVRERHDELHELSEELKNLALQREEDLDRTKERMDLALREVEGKLAVELRNRYA